MSYRMLMLALSLTTILSACNSKPYNSDTAIKNGDIVNLHGNIKNSERLEEFHQNNLLGSEDKIRITQFTIEGDPIFYDLDFNGEVISFRYDNSKDKFGTTSIRLTTCRTLTKTNTQNGYEYGLEGCYGQNEEIGNNFKFEVKSLE